MEMGQAIAANDAGVVRVIREILNSDIGLKWGEMLVNEGKTVSQSLKQPPPSENFKDFLERKSK
jgi:hypothetical protein